MKIKTMLKRHDLRARELVDRLVNRHDREMEVLLEMSYSAAYSYMDPPLPDFVRLLKYRRKSKAKHPRLQCKRYEFALYLDKDEHKKVQKALSSLSDDEFADLFIDNKIGREEWVNKVLGA